MELLVKALAIHFEAASPSSTKSVDNDSDNESAYEKR